MITVLLPNYKTPELTRLCLRSLRKYTDFTKLQVLAVDNASGDESVEYWIPFTVNSSAFAPTNVKSNKKADVSLRFVR